MVNFKNSADGTVEQALVSKGVTDKNVLYALRIVPREKFVEEPLKELSYTGAPLPIGHNQTISGIYTYAIWWIRQSIERGILN